MIKTTTPTSRRSLVRSIGTIAAVALPGCADRGEPSGTVTPTLTDTPGTISGPRILEASLDSGEGACGSEPSVTITPTADGARVTGEIIAGTPCHRASLVNYHMEGSTALFRIAVGDDLETEACVDCIGAIPFELMTQFEGTVDTVVIEVGGQEPQTFEQSLS